MRRVRLTVVLAGVIAVANTGAAADDWALHAGNEIELVPNVVYRQASGTDLKADICTPFGAKGRCRQFS